MAGNLDKMYQWTINTCNASDVGYSQPNRNQVNVNGITYYDCSSLMWYALKAGGWDVASAYTGPAVCFRTWEMAATCQRLGFNILDARTEVWKPGDILVDDWRSLGLQHTEMVYEGPPNGEVRTGKTMGAHADRDENGNPIPLADQVSINTYYSYPSSYWNQFNRLIRWGSGGAAGGYGASKYVVAAICGNWWRESLGLSPGVYENLNVVPLKALVYGGYGLGQWTNSYNEQTGRWNTRRTKLADYLDDHGYEYDDGFGQLDFFLHEAGDTGVWQAAGTGAKWASIYPTFESFMKSTSTDLLELTEAFLNCWEIGTSGLDIRYSFAQQALEFIENQGNMNPVSWITGNRYLQPPETLNNCLLIWNYLSAGGGGGGKLPYYKRHGMPIWMMINYNLI